MTWLEQDPKNRARLVGGAHSGVVLPMRPGEQRIEIGFAGREEVEVYVLRSGDCVPAIFSIEEMSDGEVEQELRLIATREAEKTARLEASRARARDAAPAALTWRGSEARFSLTSITLARDDEYLFGDLFLDCSFARLDREFYFDRASAWNLIDLRDALEGGAAGEATLECSDRPRNTSFLRFQAGSSGEAAISGEMDFPAPREPVTFCVHTTGEWLINFINAFDEAVRTAYENPPEY